LYANSYPLKYPTHSGRASFPLRKHMKRPLLILTALLAAQGTHVAAQQVSLPLPVEIRVPKPPTIAHGNGQKLLVYELHVTNLQSDTLVLKRVEVFADSNATAVATLSDSVLNAALSRPAVNVPAAERSKLAGGLRAVVFMWLPLADGAALPRHIHHRLSFERGHGDSVKVATADALEIPVSNDLAIIGPPLRGGVWLAGNGPAANSGHRRAMIVIDAAPHIAQRFAIDYLKLHEDGTRYAGDRLKNE